MLEILSKKLARHVVISYECGCTAVDISIDLRRYGLCERWHDQESSDKVMDDRL